MRIWRQHASFFFLFFQHYLWLTEFVKFTYESWVPTYMWPPYLFKCKWIWWYFISSILYVSKEGSSFQFTMHDQKIQFSFNNFVPCLLKNVKVKLVLNGAWSSSLLENVEWRKWNNNGIFVLPSLQYWNWCIPEKTDIGDILSGGQWDFFI